MAKRMLQGAVKRLLNRVIDDVLFVLIVIGVTLTTLIAFPYVYLSNRLSATQRPVDTAFSSSTPRRSLAHRGLPQ
jgi:hypothetical protein